MYRILYIEDNYHNRRLVQKVLSKNGYDVMLAEDGEQGWEVLQHSTPDLLLLDIALPGEIDGLEVLSRVRDHALLKTIHVVALTASAMHGDRERFLEKGCDDYISKPIRIGELLAKVEGLLQ